MWYVSSKDKWTHDGYQHLTMHDHRTKNFKRGGYAGSIFDKKALNDLWVFAVTGLFCWFNVS